jgi:glutamate-1-semialdehyde 2,1-aminomutase
MTFASGPELRSHELFLRAQRRMPGGVNSPVRACLRMGCEPLFVAEASGSRLTTEDGATFIDFVQSWGPLLLGHAHPEVTAAVTSAAAKGTSYGAPCAAEVLLAEAVAEAMPHVEMLRMVNSGTEAAMSALRLARGVTGRNKLVKFTGCYHGHADPFLASAGSGVATLSIPGTPGVPAAVVEDTLLAPYNNLSAVEELFSVHARDIAAVIVEPAAGNMGLVPPAQGFLEGLRALCDTHGSLLIFDEVITGFRVAFGGARERFGVTADLTALGKIIGAGLPVGAYGGRRELMQEVAPGGGIYQAGTLSGNPLAMTAGLAALRVLATSDYAGLERRVETLCRGLEQRFSARGISVRVNRLASMFTIFFTPDPVTDFASAQKADVERYAAFFRAMRARGLWMAPSGFEAAMVSFAHSDADFSALLDAVESFSL